jgi:hypothetical protein
MNQDEQDILSYYNNKSEINIISTFCGEEAWKYILQIRYQPGYIRASVKRHYKKFDKSNGYLVIYIIKENEKPIKICADYYLNKTIYNDPPNIGEGNMNMFNEYNYELLYSDNSPKILRDLLL